MIPALSFVRLNDVKQYASTLFENLPDCLDQEPKFAEVVAWFKFSQDFLISFGMCIREQLMASTEPTIMPKPGTGFIDRLKLIQRGRHVRWLQRYQARPKKPNTAWPMSEFSKLLLNMTIEHQLNFWEVLLSTL
ncbi:hypothetical protein DdX_08203 [Ditylenchus destructor]|uniref:Uncharacterized protein n=1 Tax=Ditylenchus destructor TaxID=166010 RepID=A0AAD4N8C6_9BILA|nr:hypothetical protein DdX_08203 [Ditylenchus destructor]